MSLDPKIRVLLVDDHPHVHKAVQIALQNAHDIELVAHAGNGQEAIILCAQLQPDVVLMDVVMPVMDGIEATRKIHSDHPNIRLLVLSSFQDEESVHLMLTNGAVGYILKYSLATDLVNTIRTVFHGNSVLSSQIVQSLLNTTPLTPPSIQNFRLTPREMEILRCMAEGLNNGEIAARLVISQSTVKYHIANILQKMDVETRSEAIVLAVKNDLV